MIRMYTRFKKVLAPWCSCLSIEAFLLVHLSPPSAELNPARQRQRTSNVSHRHDPTKGDAPYKSFNKNDWIPTDAVSRAWPASWNKIQKGMFISLSYHFLHLTVLRWCIWFMRFSARPAKYIMYVHQLQTHFLQYICTVYFIALSFSCDILPACFINIQGTGIHITTYILPPQMYNTRLAHSSAKSCLYPL